MTDLEDKLAKARIKIDAIDKQIQELICQRAACVADVGAAKRQAVSDEQLFYRPEREAMLLREVMQRDCGLLDEKEMANIFRTIMSACLALQQPMQIAFLGPEGTFSQAAALKHFGLSAQLAPSKSITEVFEQVAEKKVHYGIVPIENSIGGVVNETINAFVDSKVKICGEVNLAVHQHFLVDAKDTTAIKRVYSHQQSLLQCSNWLKKHYPEVEQVAVSSNAKAAQLAAEEAGAAAIAGELCVEKYQLTKQASNIEDKADNVTRFLVIGYNVPAASGVDRTSLLAVISNQPGSLEGLINPFSQNHINMTMIKSSPAMNQHDKYLFFLDVEAHQSQENFQKVLQQFENSPIQIHVLGSYPKAVSY